MKKNMPPKYSQTKCTGFILRHAARQCSTALDLSRNTQVSCKTHSAITDDLANLGAKEGSLKTRTGPGVRVIAFAKTWFHVVPYPRTTQNVERDERAAGHKQLFDDVP